MTSLPASATHPTIQIQRAGQPVHIEYQWIDAPDTQAPLLIFLHEGLGSISTWRDWPRQVCQQLGCRGLVTSRYGYGQSTPRTPDEPRDLQYLHQEAEQDLPAVLDALGLAQERPFLYGHSDGGSIALLYAAAFPERVAAIAVAAPHIFVEDMTVQGIHVANEAYRTTNMKQRLGRHHRDPDSVFFSWSDTWLTPAFRDWNIEADVANIQCPVLAIQGKQDEYGTLEQIRGIQRLTRHTDLLVLDDCRHVPHRDQPQAVIDGLKGLITNRQATY